MAKKGKQRRGYWNIRKRTELGIERRCTRCKDYWPEDTQFFHRHGKGFHSYCIACIADRCYELRNEGAVRNSIPMLLHDGRTFNF